MTLTAKNNVINLIPGKLIGLKGVLRDGTEAAPAPDDGEIGTFIFGYLLWLLLVYLSSVLPISYIHHIFTSESDGEEHNRIEG